MKVLAFVAVACLLAAPVSAQDKSRQVWVTHADSGGTVTGRIVELSKDSLAMLTPENQRVDIPLDRVLRIEAKGDSLKNGALIGAAVFSVLSFTACANVPAGDCARMAPFQILLGAVIGTGIDAMNGGRSVIYSRAARAQAAGTTTGVQFKLRF